MSQEEREQHRAGFNNSHKALKKVRVTYLEFKDFSLAKGSLDVAVAVAVSPGQSSLGGLHFVILLVHLCVDVLVCV